MERYLGCAMVAAMFCGAASAGGPPGGMVLRHCVLFKFKDDAPEDRVREIEQAFCALPEKVDTIYDFEWGKNCSTEGKSEGYTHCFLVTFLSEEGRATYLPHPAHKEFGKLLGPYLEKVLVLDYWAKVPC
ncbi:MAG TPA: Dabb family protein, partial [Candidatus Hydrogenedentes bacterium]|nr:Dabb family protein [Candidatus Hydrogenedentota bacterium]